MEGNTPEVKRDRLPFVLLPLAAIVLHILCINNYGYFRDELYYLACSKRLDWGYVDHPPFSVALLRLVTTLFGDSLFAIRMPIVIASGLTVFLVVLTADRLGAGRLGTWVAGLCVLLSGMNLVIFSFYTMNAIDIVVWAIAAYLIVRILENESLLLWALFGLTIGIGFLNKVSVLWLVSGFGLSLLIPPRHRFLARPGPWVALAVLALFALPHTIWQSQHGWPTKEFVENALKEKLLPISPWEFFGQQAVVVNVFAVPVIIAGIVFGFKKENRTWLPLSIIFLTVVLILLASGKSRVNYLAPAYAFVLPMGALAIEQWFKARKIKKRWAYVALVSASPLYLSLGLPWMSPNAMTWVISKSPIQPPVEEKGPKSAMQGWSDMFGWPELARDVQVAMIQLQPEERSKVAIVTKNYGEASALEHFGLNRVLCGHNNFWLWGPQDWNGEVAVFVNHWPPEVTELFDSFELIGTVDAPNAVPEQNGSPIWVARGLKVPVQVFWKKIRRYV